MVNRCEPLINVVIENKPKVLTSPRRANRLGPKGKGSGIGAPKGGKQMTAGIVLAGAPSSGAVHTVAPSVYREVVTGSSTVAARPTIGRLSGLSCVRGDSHAQFLGGRGPAMAPCYPTAPCVERRT
jgi:hypothetical protein